MQLKKFQRVLCFYASFGNLPKKFGNIHTAFSRDRGDHFKVVGLKNLANTNKQYFEVALPQQCRAFDFVKRIYKRRSLLLFSSGKIHTLSLASEALKNQPKQKSGRAIALPAPPPPRPLFRQHSVIFQVSFSIVLRHT